MYNLIYIDEALFEVLCALLNKRAV